MAKTSLMQQMLKDKGVSLRQFLLMNMPTTNSSHDDIIKWCESPRIKEEEEKQLSTEELFNNVKKELNKIKKM